MVLLKLIKPVLKGYIVIFVIYILSRLIIWGCSAAMPYITGAFVDQLVLGGPIKYVYTFASIVFLINIVNIVSEYISNLLLTKLNTNMVFKISFNLYERLKKVHLSYFSNIDTVYLVSRINDDSNTIICFFTENCITFFTNVFTIVLSIIVIFSINKTIAGICICLIPIYILVFHIFKNKLYNSNYKLANSRNLYFSKMTEQFSFIKFIKIQSFYKEFAIDLKNTYDNLFSILIKNVHIRYVFNNVGGFVMIMVNVFIAFYGGILVMRGSISIGMFTIINTYFAMLVSSVNYFLNLGNQYQQSLVANNRLIELLDIDIEKTGEMKLADINKISVKNLTISFDKKQNAFSNVNEVFNKGNIYIIKGMNGSGKSTFINCLLGLYSDITKGSIFYNDIDIKKLDMYYVRKKLLSATEQEPALLNTSVSRNLLYSHSSINDDMKRYCELFDISKFLDNEITNGKLNLSGGEKQKVSLIRSLLKNAPVLIADEPTSAMDQKSVDILKSELIKIKDKKIIILITHDENIFDISDKIIDFNNYNIN